MSGCAAADWSALLRLARHLVAQPRAVYSFLWQDEGVERHAFAGADFAGRFRTWRSPRGQVCWRGARQ
eukprot:4124578-Alexandrium_andersonii.AAC.1